MRRDYGSRSQASFRGPHHWLAEQIERAAVELGLRSEYVREIVVGIISETAEYFSSNPIGFSELKAKVTSPKDTTTAALDVLANAKADE